MRIVKIVFWATYVYVYAPARDLLLAMLGRSWIVVLTYHSVGQRDAVTKPLEGFRREIAFLGRTFRCITMAELCERLPSPSPRRKRYRAITFDDGYQDNYTAALPVLTGAGVPATFFVATGFVGTTALLPYHAEIAAGHATAPTHRGSNLTWANLRDMQAAGCEIGSHTVHHVKLGEADLATIRAELEESLAALNQELGARDRAFAFPCGQPGEKAVVAEIKRSGYYAAATSCGGVNRRGTDLFEIRRIDLGNGHLAWLDVRARIAGFDPEQLRTRWRGLLSAVLQRRTELRRARERARESS
jgi:peptidoglycan/xylan/chitin deacetylase (PgdA/CDA1 family)